MDRRSGARSLWGRLLAVVCLVGALVTGVGWALSSPVGSSPDDDYHLVSIWCAGSRDQPTCTAIGESASGGTLVQVPAMLALSPCFANKSETSGACQEKVEAMGLVNTDRVNDGDYPGGFYRVMHVFAGDDIPASVLTMRVFNVALAVALFAALALCGIRATRRLLTYTLAVVLVPLGWFMIASVNPSGWAVTGVTVFGFGLHSAFVVRGRRRLVANAVLAGIGAAMAMSARGDAAIYVVIVAFATCLLHWRTLLRRRLLLALPAAATAAGLAVALTSGQVATVASPSAETTRSGAEVLVNFVTNYPTLVLGIFGFNWGLGWIDTLMPPLVVCPLIGVAGFLALRGLARPTVGKALAVLTLGSVLVVIPFLTLYRARLVIGESVQPRYLLPLVPALLLILLTGRSVRAAVRMTRSQAVVVWALLSMAHAAALYTNTWRYVTGTDDATLLADAEWWWDGGAGPVATWLMASLGFTLFASAVVAVSWRRDDTRPAATSHARDD